MCLAAAAFTAESARAQDGAAAPQRKTVRHWNKPLLWTSAALTSVGIPFTVAGFALGSAAATHGTAMTAGLTTMMGVGALGWGVILGGVALGLWYFSKEDVEVEASPTTAARNSPGIDGKVRTISP